MTKNSTGWVVLDRSTPLIPAFWLDGFRSENGAGYGAELDDEEKSRISPIYRAFEKNDGLGAVQWINATHDAAAVVLADDSWVHGASFRLWVSPGAGREPYELPLTRPVTIPEGENGDLEHLLGDATNQAEDLFGAS